MANYIGYVRSLLMLPTVVFLALEALGVLAGIPERVIALVLLVWLFAEVANACREILSK